MSFRSPESHSPRERARAVEFAYIGDPDLLLTFAKHAQMPRAPGDNSRWLVLPGGGVRGAVQAGLMTAAVETKFFYGSTTAAAYSAGAPALLEGAALNTQASGIYYEDNFWGRFIGFSLRRLARLDIADLKDLEKSFRERRPMNIDTLRRCPVSLEVAITPREGKDAGVTRFVDVRHDPDPVGIMMASLALPWMANMPGVILERNGVKVRYNDCLVTTGDILTHAIDNGARDILFLMNEKFTKGAAKRFWARVQHEVGKRHRDPYIRSLLTAPRRELADMERALEGKIILKDGSVVRVGMLGPTENKVRFTDRRWQLLRRVVLDGHDDGMNRFGAVMDQAKELLYPGHAA